jgi:uncharacterized membrane protein YgdD (TMEM256/DUF423 family)
MEFLLILSAMLSAITGAFGGVRAPEARLHHETQAESVQAATPAALAAAPVALVRVAVPVVRPRLAYAAAPAFRLAASIPLYADRLIE